MSQMSTSAPVNEGRAKESRNKLANCKDLDVNQVSDYYASEEAFQFTISDKERRRVNVDEKKIREELKRWRALVKQRDGSHKAALLRTEQLNKVFLDKLTAICKEQGLDLQEAANAYVAPTGPASYVWPVQREHAYRVAVESRVSTGTINAQDKDRWMDWKDEHGKDIPIVDWIWRDVCKYRPMAPGGAPMTSGLGEPPLGRFALTPEEKTKGVKKPKYIKKSKGVKGLPWVLYSKEYLDKIKGAYDAFMEWREYREGPLRTSGEKLQQAKKLFKVGNDLRNGRAPSPPRDRDPERPIVKRNRDGGSREFLQTNLRLSDEPTENRFLQEEVEQLHWTFRLLRLHSGGEWDASVGWLTELIVMIDQFGCMVWDTGEVAYELPNGSTFRSLKDTMSFRPPELQDCLQHLSEDETDIKLDEDGLVRKFYSNSGDSIYKMAPYAARFHCNSAAIDICFATMLLYYTDLYDELKQLLDEWQLAHDSVNGGACLENIAIRQYLPDDPVYGSETCLRHELFPRGINNSLLRTSQMRVRRKRYEGDEGLPETVYYFICEINIGSGWMAWIGERLHMQDKKTGVWAALPVHEGEVRRLGWMPGDDLPDEAHDVVELSDKLPPEAKELPPLFA